MRPASQNIRFIIFYSQIIILFLYLMISGCSHFTPENKPNPSTQNEVKQSFFSNGNLEYEVEYVNGKLDGVSKVWLEDGTLYSISKYSNNQPHGIWKKFHPNGKLMFEVNYEYGQKHGVERWHYENGNLKSEQEFDYDISISEITRWNIDGTLIY
jgi:antitoxin component YwqK of YwqJK toxin-antitoxin module